MMEFSSSAKRALKKGKSAPPPANELERLEALRSYDILDTEAEQDFDDLAKLASQICQTPISTVTFVDEDRQWFKARVGQPAHETPRDLSFCAHAILETGILVVRDATKDGRFADNPLVTRDSGIRFYAGMPLRTPDGQFSLGAICVIDRVPRDLSLEQKTALEALARQAQAILSLRLLLKRERELSRTDPLTGVSNRRMFWEALETEASRLRRYGHQFSLASFDLDNLKKVNDELGHAAGDAVLQTVASTVQKTLRRTDTLARLGGDEFAIILSNSDAASAKAAMELVTRRVRKAMEQAGWSVTLSAGVVTCLTPIPAEALARKADELMYVAKSFGKNRICFEPIGPPSCVDQDR